MIRLNIRKDGKIETKSFMNKKEFVGYCAGGLSAVLFDSLQDN